MVTADLISALKEGSSLISNKDDDAFDRLSSRWSIGVIFCFTLLITTYSYIGDPINCFEPQEFEDQWVAYMDNICWVSNTYFVPLNESIPRPGEPHKQELQYYQWVPIVLAFQAFMFMIPGMFWNMGAASSGYCIKEVVSACKGTESINPETRDATIEYLVNNMMRFIAFRQPYKKRVMPVGKRYGRYLYIVYMLSKCLYITNAIVQLFLLSSILGGGFMTFGWDATKKMMLDREWQSSPLFPRITLCSFEIRRLGQNVHRYTVQCLLSVNLFNEIVYIVLWWWLVAVACLSIVGLLLWLFTSASPQSQKAYCHKYLRIMGRYHSDEELTEFSENFLRLDGVFTLRQIGKNTNDAVVGEVVVALWDKWILTRKTDSVALLEDETGSETAA